MGVYMKKFIVLISCLAFCASLFAANNNNQVTVAETQQAQTDQAIIDVTNYLISNECDLIESIKIRGIKKYNKITIIVVN